MPASEPSQPNAKKFKRNQLERDGQDTRVHILEDEDVHETTGKIAWGGQTFADIVREDPQELKLYMGEDDNIVFEDFADLCEVDQNPEQGEQVKGLIVPISPEKYHSLFHQ